MVRLILICCEGKTEKEYFSILKRHYRIPAYVSVQVKGEKGQHKSLVDHTVEERELLMGEKGLDQSEIESWSVCDDDHMGCTYNELLGYAKQNDVRLAFTRPQFEAFLVQHFEQSGAWKKQELYEKLANYRHVNGYSKEYNDGVKADLAWLEEAIDRKPKIVSMAIVNADQRGRQTDRCFMTVQRLVERLRELELQ